MSMPIETDDQAFASICAALDIEDIVHLVRVSDETIRSKCIPELAQLLIDLKEETQRQVCARLVTKAKAALVRVKKLDDTDSLRCRLQKMNNARRSAKGNGGGIKAMTRAGHAPREEASPREEAYKGDFTAQGAEEV